MVNAEEIEMRMVSYFEDPYTEDRITPDDYVIDTTGAIHVSTSVHMIKATPNRMLPVLFAVVDGDFVISERKLKSLRGAPHIVDGDFDCSMNALTSLAYAPKHVGSRASFKCDGNQLTSLAYAPKGCDEFVCNNNQLTHLQDAPPCKLLWATENPFTSFKNTPDHIEHLVISYAPHLPLLGLLSVKKIEFEHDPGDDAQSKQVEEILNKYAGQGKKAMLNCASDLIRAGYKDNARW